MPQGPLVANIAVNATGATKAYKPLLYDVNGNLLVASAPQIRSSGSGTITAADVASTTTTGQAGGSSFVTGTPTAGSFLQFAASQGTTLGFQVLLAAGSMALSFETSIDGGTTWWPYGAHTRGGSIFTSTTTAQGYFLTSISSDLLYRIRATSFTTGPVNIVYVLDETGSVTYQSAPQRIGDGGGANVQASVQGNSLITGIGASSTLNITAAAVIKATPGRLGKLFILIAPGTSGAITFNDATTTGGATTANQIWTIPYNATAVTAGAIFALDIPTSNGIVISAVGGGTPQYAVTWS